jgi:acyl dehydratase
LTRKKIETKLIFESEKEIPMSAAAELDTLLSMPAGTELGVSDWLVIDQEMISDFGRITRDPDPMHIDPEWAAKNSPFGGTIAFGFQTMSLLTHLLRSIHNDDLTSLAHGVNLNYGFDRLRLIAPVRVNSRIRGRFILGEERADGGDRKIRKVLATVEIEGEERPALVAEWLSAWLPPEENGGVKLA